MLHTEIQNHFDGDYNGPDVSIMFLNGTKIYCVGDCDGSSNINNALVE